MKYEARKRTALDGKTWWCVFDNTTQSWCTLTCFGKYRLKRDCEDAIEKVVR